MYVFKEPPPLYQQRNRALTIYKTSVLWPDGTYLLVGCLGGLGRSLTKWMVERGAKHFAFISRSGADKPEAARIVAGIEKFKGTSAKVYRADASDEEAVQRSRSRNATAGRSLNNGAANGNTEPKHYDDSIELESRKSSER